MKKFGRKLVLSGLALAATAATLSTSTYAWYVTNTSATVDGGTGGTAGTEVSGNLLVAAHEYDDTAKTWGAGSYSNSVTFGDDNYTQKPALGLKPVTKYNETAGAYYLTSDKTPVDGKTYYTYDSTSAGYTPVATPEAASIATYYEKLATPYAKTADTAVVEGKTYYTYDSVNKTYSAVAEASTEQISTYYEVASWIDVNGVGVAKEDAYEEISFWVLSTDASEINISTVIANVTSAFKDQKLLNKTQAPTAADSSALAINDAFHKDAVEALRFEITYNRYTAGAEGAEGTVASETTVYDVKGMYSGYTTAATCAKGGDANAYYKAVMNETPKGGATVAVPNTSFSKLIVKPGEETMVTIRIWLEGTDADCFDSCIGQSFTFDFDLNI